MARRNFENSNPDTDVELTVAYDEAVKQIKASRNRAFFLRVQSYAPVKDEAGKAFNLTGHVKVSSTQALEALESMYGKRFIEEANVDLRVFKNSMFIG